jgi:hypothetical protein
MAGSKYSTLPHMGAANLEPLAERICLVKASAFLHHGLLSAPSWRIVVAHDGHLRVAED